VLSYSSGSSELLWAWTDPDPDHWFIEKSLDGGATWSLLTNSAGSFRTLFGVATGRKYRITGQDISNNPVTATSNVVSS